MSRTESGERTWGSSPQAYRSKGRRKMSTVPTNDEQLRAEVSARYARTALQVLGTEQPAAVDPCCGPTCCTPTTTASVESRKALPVVEAEQTAGCCGPSCCSTDTRDASVITSDLYTQAELGTIPVAAALASLGCGNPTALAELKPGERVLDLGSGGGIDVLLSACPGGPPGLSLGPYPTAPHLGAGRGNP